MIIEIEFLIVVLLISDTDIQDVQRGLVGERGGRGQEGTLQEGLKESGAGIGLR